MNNAEILSGLGLEKKELNKVPVVTVKLIGDADDGDTVTRVSEFYLNNEDDKDRLKKVVSILKNRSTNELEKYIGARLDKNNGYSAEVVDDNELKFLCNNIGFSTLPGYMCFSICDISIKYTDENGVVTELQIIK